MGLEREKTVIIPSWGAVHIVLMLLFAMCIAAFIAGWQLNSAAAFGLSSAALVFFVAIFAVGVLDYKIGGSQVTLERRIGSLEKENTELKESVTALLKCLYVMSDGASVWDGPTERHLYLVSEYLRPISHLYPADIEEKVAADIATFKAPSS